MSVLTAPAMLVSVQGHKHFDVGIGASCADLNITMSACQQQRLLTNT